MRRCVYLFLLALVALVGCSQYEIDVESVSVEERVEQNLKLNVSLEGDDTRIYLDDDCKTVWNKNDLLTVFYKSETYQQWQFQGNTGDRSGVITPVGNVTRPSKEGSIVVLYPDNANYVYNMAANTVKLTTTAEQHYVEDSYGAGGNIMVSQSVTENIGLKNVYGWLRIALKGDNQSIRSIKLTGNNGEQLAGNIQIDVDDATASFVADKSPIKSITLNCADGVALSKSSATMFYIGLMPQTFSRGITIEIENTRGEKMTKSTSKKVVISRRTILPMSAFEFVPEPAEVFYPANNQVWYNTYGGDFVTYKSQPFDANITSHESGVCIGEMCYSLYCITCDASVTAVNSVEFYNSDLQIIYLPHSVTTIGGSAFFKSQNLEEVHIGSGIKSIGDGAFTNCGNMQKLYIRATTPPSLGNYALLSDSSGMYTYIGCTIYVPESAVAAYKAHPNWSKYADYIRAYDFVAGKEPESGDEPIIESPFNHRLLIVDHTGVNCGYCPQVIDRLNALANSKFAEYYNEVAIHGGAFAPSGVDPAYSYAATVVNKFYSPTGYPSMYLNFADGTIARGSSDLIFVNTTMGNIFNANRNKFGADAGIAITTSAKSGKLSIDVDVMAAKEQKYNIAVWVLENNISSPDQNGATSDLHRVANHALRYIANSYNQDYMLGDSLGYLSVGQVAEKSYSVTIDNSWVAANLEVLVIVSDEQDVVNTAVCPVNATRNYEYMSDVETL